MTLIIIIQITRRHSTSNCEGKQLSITFLTQQIQNPILMVEFCEFLNSLPKFRFWQVIGNYAKQTWVSVNITSNHHHHAQALRTYASWAAVTNSSKSLHRMKEAHFPNHAIHSDFTIYKVNAIIALPLTTQNTQSSFTINSTSLAAKLWGRCYSTKKMCTVTEVVRVFYCDKFCKELYHPWN
jgi:hypothetical protein